MRVLFMFLDGVGLGVDDPIINPLARAHMPHLHRLLGGQKMLAASAPYNGPRARLRAIDANLGVSRLPQSATRQAVLVDRINNPAAPRSHYGPQLQPGIGA